MEPGVAKTTLPPVDVIRSIRMLSDNSRNLMLPVAVTSTEPELPSSSSSEPVSPMPPALAVKLTSVAAVISARSVLA